jgi:hypothetical protein
MLEPGTPVLTEQRSFGNRQHEDLRLHGIMRFYGCDPIDTKQGCKLRVSCNNKPTRRTILRFLVPSPNLQTLDLTNNNLQGPIPVEIGQLQYHCLELDNNDLTE